MVSRTLLVLGILAWTAAVRGQGLQEARIDETDTRAVMKANFVYHFAAGNDWPDEVKRGNFRVAVIGNDRLYRELVDKYALKPIGAQSLEVVRVEPGELSGFYHIVYAEASDLRRIASAIGSKPTLLVTERAGALAEGATINFVVRNNRILYEIDSAAASRRGVLLGSKILSWAVSN
jgi:hypothetical protein